MTEKKYETASDFVDRYLPVIEDYYIELRNKFINKDKLRDKIRKLRGEYINKINKDDNYNYSKLSINKVGTCEIICSKILKLLEE